MLLGCYGASDKVILKWKKIHSEKNLKEKQNKTNIARNAQRAEAAKY